MPDASRRAVLAAGGLATVAVMVGAQAAPAAASARRTTSIPLRGSFAALRGTRVTLRGPAGLVGAVVTDVTDLVGAPAGDDHQFSVLFRPSRPLPDGIYQVSSSRLGSTDLFLSNVDRRRAAALQAIVSVAPERKASAAPVQPPQPRPGA